ADLPTTASARRYVPYRIALATSAGRRALPARAIAELPRAPARRRVGGHTGAGRENHPGGVVHHTATHAGRLSEAVGGGGVEFGRHRAAQSHGRGEASSRGQHHPLRGNVSGDVRVVRCAGAEVVTRLGRGTFPAGDGGVRGGVQRGADSLF